MKVSVVIPAYNHEKYIEETITSVLNQTYDLYEIVIVDDGSTDRTRSVIHSIKDHRIKYYHQENKGAHAAINKGIELAAGEYISILNSDDTYEPDRLQDCVDFIEKNPHFSVVISKVRGIDSQSCPVNYKTSRSVRAWLDWYADALPRFCQDKFLPNVFLKNILITTSNFFIRKKMVEKVGGFLPLRYAHDWDMLLRLSGEGKIHLLEKPLLNYRIHPENTIQEFNSEPLVKFEVNWLIAENIKYLYRDQVDVAHFTKVLEGNHYLSIDVILALLAYGKEKDTRKLLSFNHPYTKKIIAEFLTSN